MENKVDNKQKKLNKRVEVNYEDKIDIATQTLERNIGFVANCDNKTSIVLAIIGVFLTIILTNDGLNTIYGIINTCIEMKTFCSIMYLFALGVAIVVMVLGIYNLCIVLIAKTSETAEGVTLTNSRIFFTGINRHGNYEVYKAKFYEMSEQELLDELIAQIYINSDIASKKYNKYNKGVKWTIIGFGLFVVILLIGIYLY